MHLRRLACLLSAVLCGWLGTSRADEPAAPPLVSIERQGYAFEYPRVLAEQRLFGIAHGIALLAEACSQESLYAQSTDSAYRQWYEQQQLLVESLQSNLADFYFGPRAGQASWKHIAATLSLRERISPEPGSEQMAAACASLPEALQQPRYDLNSLFQLEAAMAATTQAVRVDTQVAACLPRLPAAGQDELRAAYADWQGSEAAAAEQAQVQLLHYWRIIQTESSVEDWKKAVAAAHAKPAGGVCNGLAAGLRTPQAALAQSFALAPAPTLPAETDATPDHSVTAVTLTQPETAAAAAAPDATENTAPSPGVLDFLMKAFDERPYESRPPRSQRAHP
jgi:hypothetical protein